MSTLRITHVAYDPFEAILSTTLQLNLVHWKFEVVVELSPKPFVCNILEPFEYKDQTGRKRLDDE